ncbi:hypothetical protein ACFFWD_28925 [Bradyrhizobium erythrophlei]|uniref:hypothetical protein n=1 Tax=Bradyrhizobium erythrophlei TaxID=1437360 RepID=UPI0035E963D1
MRIAQLVFASSLAAVAIASPALAKSSDRQKADDKSTAAPACQAYQQAADGTWTQLPCGETGGASGSTQHRTTTKDADDDAR